MNYTIVFAGEILTAYIWMWKWLKALSRLTSLPHHSLFSFLLFEPVLFLTAQLSPYSRNPKCLVESIFGVEKQAPEKHLTCQVIAQNVDNWIWSSLSSLCMETARTWEHINDQKTFQTNRFHPPTYPHLSISGNFLKINILFLPLYF